MKRWLAGLCAVFLVLVASGLSYAELPTRPHVINNMPDILRIDKFAFGSDADAIPAWITVTNVSGQGIDGIQLGCAFTDYFDESWSVYGGFSAGTAATAMSRPMQLKPKASTMFAWTFRHTLNPPLTGYVWVDRIRLADGTIMRADLDAVAAQIAAMSGLPVTGESLR